MKHIFQGQRGSTWSYDDAAELGRGGFGVVYEGHGEDGKPIAVKVFDLSHPRAEPVARLMREVDIAGRIREDTRQHLLPVIDHALTGATVLLVMERAEHSLAQAIVAGLDDPERLEVLRAVASGLAELHGIPVLHRDLKPGNILFHESQWKLADFGIARHLDDSTATLTWAGAGTLSYMAPELFSPPYAATVKSDLYALGCLAFELWAGVPPFEASDPHHLVEMQRHATVPPVGDSVNVALRRLILRLLEKHAQDRPQDARAVVEALGRVNLGPVSPEGARLQTLVSTHLDERSQQVAEAEAERLRDERHQAQTRQALADLREIAEAGCDLVNGALPDVVYRSDQSSVALEGPEATLRLRVWGVSPRGSSARWTSRPQRDDHVLYGVALGHNSRMGDEPPLGNLVCEVRDGRLEWACYRYRRAALMSQYRLGPSDRRHGFSESQLFDTDVFPFAFRDWNGVHIFHKEVAALTPELVRDLYAAALALPADG